MEPLHFAEAVLQLSDRHAASRGLAVEGQEESPVRGSIRPWKYVKLLLEALEAQVEPERLGVFHKQLPDGAEVPFRLAQAGFDHGWFARSIVMQ
jgi:hypothetical protein